MGICISPKGEADDKLPPRPVKVEGLGVGGIGGIGSDVWRADGEEVLGVAVVVVVVVLVFEVLVLALEATGALLPPARTT